MKRINYLVCVVALCLVLFSSVTANEGHHAHSVSRYATSLPSWELNDANDRVVSSSQFAGKPYVLVFHLGKGCLHCAKQLHAVGDQASGFEKAGVEVIGVSTDSKDQLTQQLKNFGSSFPIQHLASDHDLKLFRGVGAFDDESDKPLHATILVDGAGRIRWSNMGDHPFMEIDQLLAEANLVSVGATTTQEDENPDRPKIFLDKSPKIVQYQLRRLSNERLLMVSRKTDDKKYAPVWSAILTRAGMERQYRKEALNALVGLNGSSAAAELLTGLEGMKINSDQEKTGALELASMLLRLDKDQLDTIEEQLVQSTGSDNEVLAQASFAALTTAGLGEKVNATDSDGARTINWIRSVGLVRNQATRNALRDGVFKKIDDDDDEIAGEAILAMRHFSGGQKETWTALAKKINDPKLRTAAIETLLELPAEARDAELTPKVIEKLLKKAESTPANKRTNKNALLAMEFADELIAELEDEDASGAFRKRMGAVAVRVVRIKTIKEEMRYDVPYFAAEAGRPIQVVLDNVDLMPHNLIVCKPGTLKQVASDGLAAGPLNGKDGKQYVPKTDDVLFATDMVQANRKERLTFKAPRKPGAYPYVCTFPQHWSRMYGVMVVVDDLQAWEKNPVQPEDPIGNKRQLVKNWSMADFADDIEADLSGHSAEAGKRIFTEATCAQCHRLGDFGGAGANVGPALDELYKRWKNDRGEALKQILDPSSHVDPKYQMHIIATDDGLTHSGVIVKQDDESIEMLESGSISETTTILKDEVMDMAESKKSIMPKALLDNYTKEEILDLMHYLESNQK